MQLLTWTIHKAYDTWVAWQVELHGQFSLERMRKLEAFAQRTSLPRAMAIGSLTPIPCLVLISLIDAVPLASPDEGTNANYVHWARNYLTIVFMSYAILEQFRYTVPGLPMSLCRLNTVALLASLGGVGFQFIMSHAIGFPLPFSIVVGTPVWTVVIVTLFWIYFAALLRANEQFRVDLMNYMHVFFCQVGLTFIYPAYVYGFQSISPETQQFYVVLLPLLKIALKNWITRFLGELDDMKPEIAIFNVELFNALYLACCVQRSRSIMTTLVVSCGDWFIALLSFRDIMVKHRAVVQFMDAIPHDHAWHGKSFVEVARLVVDEDAVVREHPTLKASCTSSGQEVLSFAQSKRTARTTVPRESAMVVPVAPVALVPNALDVAGPPSTLVADTKAAPSEPETAASTAAAAETLVPSDQGKPEQRAPHFASRDERLRFVQSVLQLLFTTEFVILLEYTIVCAATIYSTGGAERLLAVSVTRDD